MHKYFMKQLNPANEVLWWEIWSYQSSATATFKFSCNLVLLPVSDDEVWHTHSGKWLIMKSECSKEAAAKMHSAYHLESHLCASCMHWCVFVFCWFRQEETFSAECFYRQTELPWKFSCVFPAGGRALRFWLIKVISHFGITFTVFTSCILI